MISKKNFFYLIVREKLSSFGDELVRYLKIEKISAFIGLHENSTLTRPGNRFLRGATVSKS